MTGLQQSVFLEFTSCYKLFLIENNLFPSVVNFTKHPFWCLEHQQWCSKHQNTIFNLIKKNLVFKTPKFVPKNMNFGVLNTKSYTPKSSCLNAKMIYILQKFWCFKHFMELAHLVLAYLELFIQHI